MRTAISFTIPGRIGGKGRARSTGGGHHYTPQMTRSHEALVRHFAALQMRERALLEGPLRLHITVWRHHPRSWSEKKKAGAVYVTGKPDCDNTEKLIADAMNHVVYHDDSQISVTNFARMYDISGGEERVVVLVETLSPGRVR